MAKKSNFQIKIEYYAVKVLFTLLGFLPRFLAIRLGLLVGDLAYLVLGRLKKIARTNLEIAFPDLSENEKKRLTRGCFRSLGRQLGEVTQFPKATKESLSKIIEFPFTAEEWANYEKLKEQGRGVIFLTPHFGGWEVLALGASALLGPQSYLVRRLDNPLMEEFTANLRGKFGNVPMDKSEATLPALQLLRKGEHLGILADVNIQAKEGVFVPFFSRLACTTVGVAALAMRTNALIVLFAAPWIEEKQKYVVQLGGVFEFESTGNRQQDLIDLTAKYTKATEEIIKKFPDQWLWIHKRWKTRPEGESEIY
ncbi:MAG: lysophospholipid acyltransferase family protein [Pyrinomonadaceae bacterium]|nr:lysophospholipid acyltransferase family protein [Pyrinomonadaceae bacterium]